MLKKVVLHSVATAFARRVLPVPGMCNTKYMLIPRDNYRFGQYPLFEFPKLYQNFPRPFTSGSENYQFDDSAFL